MRPVTRLFLPVVLLVAIFGGTVALPVTALAQTISYLGVPLDVGSALQSSLLRAQLSDSQHGGITVRIESADTLLALVSDAEQTPGTPFVEVFVPNGSVNANFWIQALEDTTGTVTITASATGFTSAVDSIDVVPPAIRLKALVGSGDVFAIDDDFYAQVGLPSGTNSNISVFQAARAGGPGLTVTVTNSNSAVGELVTTALTGQVASVIILPGQISSQFNVPTGGVAFNGIAAGVTEVTAAIPGFIATKLDTQTVTVTASSISYLGLPFDAGAGLETGQINATLSGKYHGGVTVHIESGDTLLALVSTASSTPGTPFVDVFVADGLNQAKFFIHALEDTTGASPISATAPGFIPVVDTARVLTPSHRIASLASSIDVFESEDVFVVQIGLPRPDLSALLTIQTARAGGPGLAVTLTSSDSTVGGFVTNDDTSHVVEIQIAPLQSNTPGSVGTGGVAFNGLSVGSTEVTAAIPGFVPTLAGTLGVAVTQPGISLVNMPLQGVGAGLQSAVVRARLSASAHGGTIVHIESADSLVLLVSSHKDSVGVPAVDVFVPNGLTNASFWIHGIEDTTGTVTITASAPQFSDGAAATDIKRPGLILGSLVGTIDTIDPPDNFRIQTGVPLNGGVSVFVQVVRAGSPGIVVSASVDDSLLARILTQADTSDVVSLVVPAGESNTPNTVALGGFALDGIALGTVTVLATAAGFDTTVTAQQSVTITAPTINIIALFDVGAGLQGDKVTATLSASTHGGTIVHVESSDSLVALVSADASSPGQPAVDIFVPNGSTKAEFYVHGVDDTTGAVSIAVSASQFITEVGAVTIVEPAVDIVSLASSVDISGGSDEFSVRVGVPDAGNTFVQIPQVRRSGAPPLVATVTSTDTTVARVATTSSSGDSVTVDVAAGENQSPPDLFSGGVELQPISEGQTIVFASIPGFIQTGAAQRVIDVSNTTITYLGLPVVLGAGLETNLVTAQLGSSGHGGVTVHVEVDDTTRALVSANALVVGDIAIDVVVVNGQTDAAFYVQAKEDSLGAVLVTASAPGFTTVAQVVEIVPPAVQIVLLPDSMDVGDPDAEFVVQIGAMLADSSTILEPQLVRPGGIPAAVTVTSSDAAVGTIETSSTSGDSATATIGVGEGQTALTVVSGGMAFHAVGTGAAIVEATVPGFLTTTAGSPTVYIAGGPTGVPENKPPAHVTLEQNTPNPFNPATTIAFSLPAPMEVDLTIFDVSGRRVIALVHRAMPAGRTRIQWNGRDINGRAVSSGVYFYRLRSGSNVQTKKMVLLK